MCVEPAQSCSHAASLGRGMAPVLRPSSLLQRPDPPHLGCGIIGRRHGGSQHLVHAVSEGQVLDGLAGGRLQAQGGCGAEDGCG